MQSVVDPLILRELREGELLLWSGRPDPKRRILPGKTRALERSALLRLVALIVSALAAPLSFFLRGSLPGGGLVTLLLAGCAALLLLSLMRAMPQLAAERAFGEDLKRTHYAITNQRVLVITTGHYQGVHSYTRQDLGRIERVERYQDGYGDVIFNSGQGSQRPGAAARFFAIANAREVETLLLQTFKEGAAG